MTSTAVRPAVSPWLAENGPAAIELLFRAIVFHPSSPILIADDDRNYRDASIGASRFLGVGREKLIGRRVDDFAGSAENPTLAEQWVEFLQEGQKAGTLQLVTADGTTRNVEYKAKSNVLPIRHLLLMREEGAEQAWTEDFALFLLDADGRIVIWYAGAERIYGFTSEEVAGKSIAFLYPPDTHLSTRVDRKLRRAATEGHAGGESWHLRKDGSQFWANAITMALRDDNGELQGYARVVRDFTDRYERDERFRSSARNERPAAEMSTIAGVVSGEFDRVLEMNDRFLDLAGYSREDLEEGRINWADLSPKEYAAADEFAHEEGLRFGACSPYEKELNRKDGTRIPVLIATAVLKISPYRWITFVTDLRDGREGAPSAETLPKHDFTAIIGNSGELRRVLHQVELVAPTDATVLILGETGTGKELIAQALHRLSPRRNFPFVSVNCAAIPTGLLESELFGYEKGAFTGALQQKIGRFEMANRGTLFLDEVGDIPLELQPKLLRALQEKCFERLGSTRTTPIDIRVVAATNRNLTQMVGDNLFRSDLYYRLKVFPIALPPLRDRPEDIAPLVWHFTKKYADKMDRTIDRIPPGTMQSLMNWHWPGNIRELENFIERSVILSSGRMLAAPMEELAIEGEAPVGGSMDEVEREHILRTLQETKGVVSKAAMRLRMPRTTLNGLMKKHGITRKSF